MKEREKGHFIGLTPIILFITLVLIVSAISKDFSTMPILVALFIAAAYALTLNPKGKKISFTQKVEHFCIGAGEKTIILLVFIFLLAGAFYALTIDIGARDATVNWGLKFIPTHFVLPGLFIISCFISFAMGTSLGTVTAVVPIGVGLASSLNLPVTLTTGIVIGGAMFGDNLSFISDTTIAAAKTQGVKMRDKFKVNLIVVLPAVFVTFVLLMFIPIEESALIHRGAYDFILILPYLIIIASALFGLNVIAVLGIGISSAALVGLFTGSFDMIGLFQSMHKGMKWMEDLSLIALTVGGIVELMRVYGGIDWLISRLTKRIKSSTGAEFSIAALVSLLDLATANNTIAIVSAGPIAKELSQKYGIDKRRTAGLLDIFSCGFQGLVPYGSQLLTAAALAGISPLGIIPYCWYSFFIIIFGFLSIIFNYPKLKKE